MQLFPGARAPAPTLEQPLEMLAACHERIEAQVQTLERLVPHVAAHGADQAAAEAARAVLRYFDTAGVKHHEDEEEDLFPLLQERGPPEVGDLLARLRGDHAAMRTAWAGLRPSLAGVAEGTGTELDRALAEQFASQYRNHIALETQRLLPLAGRVLRPKDIEALSERMVRRRAGPPENVV
jgi:hemerythrin-like domain-containing protein